MCQEHSVFVQHNIGLFAPHLGFLNLLPDEVPIEPSQFWVIFFFTLGTWLYSTEQNL